MIPARTARSAAAADGLCRSRRETFRTLRGRLDACGDMLDDRRDEVPDLFIGVLAAERDPQSAGAAGYRRRSDGGDQHPTLPQLFGSGQNVGLSTEEDRDDR